MKILLCSVVIVSLSACTALTPSHRAAPEATVARVELNLSTIRVSTHRDSDDLLSAGLGLTRLQSMVPPEIGAADAPTVEELRRRAIYANWRAIADFSPGGHYGSAESRVENVPGREYSAFARINGARQPHRVLAQIPDGFDQQKRCLLVNAASGSRGVYGSIALAGAWGLPRGCAVVYTDKGAGTGFVDMSIGGGVALDGSQSQDSALLEFSPGLKTELPWIASKHAYSQDNPEASWGEQVLQAAHFGLTALDQAFPEQAPFTPENTRIIAVGLSNGGGAVLRAAEIAGAEMIDAVVAISPNISTPNARPLFDYATEAALLQPCALLALNDAVAMLPGAQLQALAAIRCASLKAAGMLSGETIEAQAQNALLQLRQSGWTDASLLAASSNIAFDLWRSLIATYASSYSRSSALEPSCGYRFAALDASFKPRATTAAERALWASDGSGIVPTAGLLVVDAQPTLPDLTLNGLVCARALWTGNDAAALALQRGVAEIRASGKSRVSHTLVVHGQADALIPIQFTSAPYVAAMRASGQKVSYWQIKNAQHFDAFLIAPAMTHFEPMLPHAYAALDAVWDTLNEGSAMPADVVR